MSITPSTHWQQQQAHRHKAQEDLSCRYMAAVQAAAAEAARDSGSKKGGGLESRPPSVQKAPPPAAREREKLLERLRGACEGGSVIPVPFLPAAHAVPSALLDDLRAPYLLHPHPHPAQTYALLVSQLLLVDPGTITPLPPPRPISSGHHPCVHFPNFACHNVRSYCVTCGDQLTTLRPHCFWPQDNRCGRSTVEVCGVEYVWQHDVSTPGRAQPPANVLPLLLIKPWLTSVCTCVPDRCCHKQMLPVDMFVSSLCPWRHDTYEYQYLDRSRVVQQALHR